MQPQPAATASRIFRDYHDLLDPRNVSDGDRDCFACDRDATATALRCGGTNITMMVDLWNVLAAHSICEVNPAPDTMASQISVRRKGADSLLIRTRTLPPDPERIEDLSAQSEARG